MSRTRILLTQDDPSAVGWLHGLPSVNAAIMTERTPQQMVQSKPRSILSLAGKAWVKDAYLSNLTVGSGGTPAAGMREYTGMVIWRPAAASAAGGALLDAQTQGGYWWLSYVFAGDTMQIANFSSPSPYVQGNAAGFSPSKWMGLPQWHIVMFAMDDNGASGVTRGRCMVWTIHEGVPGGIIHRPWGSWASAGATCPDWSASDVDLPHMAAASAYGDYAFAAMWKNALTEAQLYRRLENPFTPDLAWLVEGATRRDLGPHHLTITRGSAIRYAEGLRWRAKASRARFYDLAAITTPALDHWFPLSTTTADGWLKLQVGGTAPADATLGTGWHVDALAAGQYARMAAGVVRLSSVFSGTAQPSGGPDSSLKDCFRTENKVTVDIPAGTWTVPIPFIASAAGQEGAQAAVCVRLWYSANADGSTPTEITAGATVGTTVTNLQSEAAQVSTVTISLGAVAFTAKYLFVQVALKVV